MNAQRDEIIINRTKHGRLEISNFSSSVEKYFTSDQAQQTNEIFFNTRREITYLQAAMLCSVYYINTNEIPNHCKRRDSLCNCSSSDLFT